MLLNIQLLVFLISQFFLYLLLKKIEGKDQEYSKIYHTHILIKIIFSICIIGMICIRNDIFYTLILSIFLLGSFEDINTQYVSDIFQYLTFLIVLIYFIMYLPKAIDWLYIIPILFLIITWKMRGSADSISLCTWSLYYISIFNDPIYLLIAYFISYLLQGIIQIIICIIKKYSWKGKPVLAFLPSITLGMGFTVLLFI